MFRRTEEVGTTVGLPCHRHFLGFSNVPVQVPTRVILFTATLRNLPITVAFYGMHGDTEAYCHLKHPDPQGGRFREKKSFFMTKIVLGESFFFYTRYNDDNLFQ